jgi:hypothetical protein
VKDKALLLALVGVAVVVIVLRLVFKLSPVEVLVLTRNKRNKNPLNVRLPMDGQTWEGQVGVDTAKGGPFAIFGANWQGWRAGMVTLLNYQKKHGLNTVAGIITRFAPASDGNTPWAYADRVAKRLGLEADQPFDVRAKVSQLALEMARVEGGTWPDFDPERDAGATAAKAYVK